MNTSMRSLILLAGLCCTGLSRADAEEGKTVQTSPEKQVGSLSDVERIRFEGNTTFSDAELRAGLNYSQAFVIESHPAAPLDTFLARIATALETGYQRGGFPEPKASVKLNAAGDAILVVIQEGQRVRNGELFIEGVDASLATMLRAGLTENRRVLKKDLLGEMSIQEIKAIWKPNEPTDSHAEAERWIRGAAKQLLEEEGWFAAEVEARIEVENEIATATVHVKSIGPGSIIDTIRVTGAKRNSESDVLELLELREGVKITGTLLDDRRQRLYTSGRFLQSDITMTRKSSMSMEVDLEINLIESKEIPPLNQPFSRETHALLKAGEWLTRSLTSEYDVVFSGASTNGTAFHAALSGREGLMLAYRFPREGAPADPSKLIAEPADVIFIISASRLVARIAGVKGEWRYEIKLPVDATIKFLSSTDPEQPFSFTAGVQTSSTYSKKKAVPLILRIDPAVIAGNYIRQDLNSMEIAWKGDQVAWTSTNTSLSVNASTGRLIEMKHASNQGFLSLHTERGGFDRLRNQLDPNAPRENRFSADAPLTSSAQFFTEALARLNTTARGLDPEGKLPPPEAIAQFTEALLALLEIGALAPADELVKKIRLPHQETFHPTFSVPYEDVGAAPGNPTLLMLIQLLEGLSTTLPENGWADRLFTEMAHIARGNARYTQQVLDALYEDTENNGPIAYLLMANLLNLVDKQQSARFAQQGLLHLTAEDFQRDWHPLINDPVAEHLFNEFITAIPTLDAKHQTALDRILGANAADGAADYLSQLDQENTRTLSAFLDPGMAGLWDRQIRAEVEKQLKSIGPPPLDTDYPVATVDGVAVTRRALTPWMGSQHVSLAQAREAAINVEATHQYYYAKNQEATQALMDELMTEHAELVAMLESGGTPTDVIKKSLLYQEVMRRQLTRLPAPTEAEIRAYYEQHRAAINQPFEEVKAQLAISLNQPAQTAHLEQWSSAMRQGRAIFLLPLEAPSARKNHTPPRPTTGPLKRSPVFLLSTRPYNGFGVFISEDGLALVDVQTLIRDEAPSVLLADGTELALGPILGIFPEQELALIKLNHAPKIWLERAMFEPEINETLSLVVTSLQDPWSEKIPPIVGPVMAKRSARAANSRDRLFVNVLSLGARPSPVQRSTLGPGRFAVNQEGELVAFTAGATVDAQTIILLAPIVELGAKIDELAAEGKDIGFPLPAALNPVDPAALDLDFHPQNVAQAQGNWAEFQRLVEGLHKRYPESILTKSNLAALTNPTIQQQLPHALDVGALLESLAINSNDPASLQAANLSIKAQILMTQGRYQQAIPVLKEAIALSPKDYPRDRISLASLYAMSGKLAEAEELAQELYLYNSDSVDVVSLLGYTLTGQGKFERDAEFQQRLAELHEIYNITGMAPRPRVIGPVKSPTPNGSTSK